MRLVNKEDHSVIAEEKNNLGIFTTHELWEEAGGSEEHKFDFYLKVIIDGVKIIEEITDRDLSELPLVISGMASSSIGMMELPYRSLPILIDGSDLEIKLIESSSRFRSGIMIISGVSVENDVMRGEETMLIGAVGENNGSDHLFIFPGTHSKHVLVNKDQAIELKTYMTGEFFDLFSNKSLLASSVEAGGRLEAEENKAAFRDGAKKGLNEILLNSSFLVRTNQLFNKYSKQQNYFFLSGLIIGTELKSLKKADNITIVADSQAGNLYSEAILATGIKNKIAYKNSEEALIDGQIRICKNYLC